MRKRLLLIADFIADTNVFIAIGAAVFTGCSYWFFGLSANVYLLAHVFFGTLFMYNFQRWVGDLAESARFRTSKKVLMFGGLMGALLTLLYLKIDVVAVLAMAGAIAVMYALPIFPKGGMRYSLRKLPYVKTWNILIAWLLTGILAPFLDQAWEWSPEGLLTAGLFGIQQGAVVLVLATAFDIRDLKYDTPGQKTLPQILGVTRSLQFNKTLIWISMLACALLYLFGVTALWPLMAHLITVGTMLLLNRRVHSEQHPLFFAIAIDGVLILQGLLLILT